MLFFNSIFFAGFVFAADNQGPGDAISCDSRLDRRVSRRQQGHDGVDGRTKHAHRAGHCSKAEHTKSAYSSL